MDTPCRLNGDMQATQPVIKWPLDGKLPGSETNTAAITFYTQMWLRINGPIDSDRFTFGEIGPRIDMGAKTN
jgi:hypothetical protein